MSGVIVIGPPPGYCRWCYGDAIKDGRPVRKSDVSPDHEACAKCESFARSGMIHYSPSNGTEYDIFVSQCARCRHYIDDLDNPRPGRMRPPFTACTWGVLDRLHVQMVRGPCDASRWLDPDDIDNKHCPAECKRFTPKDDPHGELRDPPTPDAPGQMMLGEALDVPEPTLAPEI